MKTYRLYFVLAALVNLVALPSVHAQTENCGTTIARERLLKEHPEALIGEQTLETFTREFEAAGGTRDARSGNLIIPIVFHILHQGGAENISDAQVLDEVRILNRDWNLQNSDTSLVIPSFRDIMANMGITFRLANIDPWGNCTNGIEHIFTDQTNMGNDYSKIHNWPREKYVNVWVTRMSSAGAGYAYYPGSVAVLYNVPAMDGVLLGDNYIGSIGTSSPYTSRALTHEIGHCFNLKHCWGDSNEPGVACGDDDVLDTPPTKGWASCPSNPNAAAICHPPVIENYQNYMEYSYCSEMFTNGQKARVLAALNSSVSGRNNLWSDSNLVATGTADTFVNPCAPIAGIAVTKRYACINTNVTFKDASSNGTIDSYYWEFPNGVPNTSTDQNPVTSFTTPGWQPVIHTVGNGYGQSTMRDTFMMYIGYEQALYQAPFTQDFEDPTIFSQDWAAVNYDENNTSFKQINYSVSHSGTGAAMLNNYLSHSDRDIDEIVTPGFDMTPLSIVSSLGQMSLSFYYSLASANQYFSDLTDSIAVLATSNCGTTWAPIYTKGGTNAVNAGFVQGFFAPTQAPSYWRYVKIPLGNNWHQSNVRFKFQVFSAARGNNFYIDDINIGQQAVTGINDISVLNDINLFPNPTDGDANLALTLAQPSKVSVKVYDIAGKEMLNVFEGNLNDGENQLPITGTNTLAKGVYIVNIKAGDASAVQKKLVIQ